GRSTFGPLVARRRTDSSRGRPDSEESRWARASDVPSACTGRCLGALDATLLLFVVTSRPSPYQGIVLLPTPLRLAGVYSDGVEATTAMEGTSQVERDPDS